MLRVLTLIFLTSIIFLFQFGCKKELISESNLENHNYDLVNSNCGYSISMPHFYNILYKNDFHPNGGIIDKENLQAILDSIIIDTLLGVISDETDISDYDDIKRRYLIRYNEELVNSYFYEKIQKDVMIDSIEVVEHYNSHPEIYDVEEQAFVYHIIATKNGFLYSEDSSYYQTLTEKELESLVKKRIDSVYGLLGKEQIFKTVAREHSHNNDAYRNSGALNWVKKNRFLPPFDSVVFALKPEQYSKPYQDKDGWHIVYMEDYHAKGSPEITPDILLLAGENLLNEIVSSIRKPLMDSLRNVKREIVINEEILNDNLFYTKGSTWAAIINERDTINVYTLRNPEKIFRAKYGVINTTPDMKREMIESTASWYITIQAAEDEGIDKLPRFVALTYQWRHDYLKNVMRAKLSEKSYRPSAEAIENYYNANIDKYVFEKPMVVQHILLEDSITAEFIYDQANSGIEFLNIAKEYYFADEDKRVRLANIGLIGKGDVEEEFYQRALITNAGYIARPVKTIEGFHVIKVIERQYDKSVYNARPEIMAVLKKKRNQEVYENYKELLFSKYEINFPKKLAPIHLPPVDYRDR